MHGTVKTIATEPRPHSGYNLFHPPLDVSFAVLFAKSHCKLKIRKDFLLFLNYYFYVRTLSLTVDLRLTERGSTQLQLSRKKIGNKMFLIELTANAYKPSCRHNVFVILVAHRYRFRLLSTTSIQYMPVLMRLVVLQRACHTCWVKETNNYCNLCAKSGTHSSLLYSFLLGGCVICFRLSQYLFVFSIDERWLTKILLCSCASTKKICCY